MSYNPSDVGRSGSLFGYPYTQEESELVLLPVPWDVTVSYGSGTSKGPQAILDASPQLDLSLYQVQQPWSYPCAMLQVPEDIIDLNTALRPQAAEVINRLESGQAVDSATLDQINQGCEQLNFYVYETAKAWMSKGKVIGLVGGDHSSPLGLLKALSEEHSFGILQIDAHMDLRKAYEGFTYSHASIMYNALQIGSVSALTQVGIRDYCEEEENFAAASNKKLTTFYDDQVKAGIAEGQSWSEWVSLILTSLPDKVYISFDIDGLQPFLCPHTGTPVPGGISFEQVDYLLRKLAISGKEIIGFDLCEVSPGADEWDANVGARVLYRLITMTGISQGKISSQVS